MNQISIIEVIKDGIEATKKNLKTVVLFFVLFDIILYLLTLVPGLGFLGLMGLIEVLFLQIAIFKSFQKPFPKLDIRQILSLDDPNTKTNLWKLFLTLVLMVILVALLFLLLIIPGIIFMVFWLVALYVVLDEGLSGMAALKRSKELIKGHWWNTFVLLLVTIVPFIIISQITIFKMDFTTQNSYLISFPYTILTSFLSFVTGYTTVSYYFKLKKLKSK